jgi:two-component system sensor histidine kinase ChvG
MASATATPPTDPAGRLERARTFLSRISIRLLAFNVLLVFLPAAGLLTLGTYERQLLRAQEQAMVQQGRLLAAALSGPDGLDAARADAILKDLQRRQQARLRVVDTSGHLVADSSRLGAEPNGASTSSARTGAEIPVRPELVEGRNASSDDGPAPSTPTGAPDTWLYRIGALPFRIYRFVAEPAQPGLESGEFYSSREQLLGPEIDAALHGRYGAATRISGGQRSVTLYAAIPIRAGHRVTGVVLVSQSTYGILQALYAVRIDVFKVVLASVAAAAVLSLLVSATIAWPLRYLRDQALALVDRRGRLQGGFRGSTTRDEIGDLTRALEQLTARLRDHMSFVESFAADVSHEFKNPLASIRTATELLPSVEDPEQRRRFLQIVQREVARMERLLAGVREISRIDAQLDDDAPQAVDLAGLLESIVEGYRLRVRQGVAFDFAKPDGAVVVRAVPDRLTQVFENLLDNALGFSPPGGTVRVSLSGEPKAALITVADQGPGVPPEHLEKVFARFFSYRPGSPNSNGHAGLGLPIAKAIVEGYGGTIEAANGAQGGARFLVRLPL